MNARRRTEQVHHEGHRIDPEVKQRAAGQLGCLEPVVRPEVQALTVVGDDGDDLADPPVSDPATHGGDVRQVPGPHRLHRKHARAARRVEDLVDLNEVARQRLFDEDVFAGPRHGDRVVAVGRVRRRDIDRVDLGVGTEGFVPGIRPRYAVSLRERARPTLIA